MRQANLEWKVPKNDGHPIRKARLAESPPPSDKEYDTDDSEDTIIYNVPGRTAYNEEDDSELSDDTVIYDHNEWKTNDVPMSPDDPNENGAFSPDKELINARVAGKRKRQVPENSDDDDDAPLADLQKRFRISTHEDDDQSQNSENETENSDQYSYDNEIGTELIGDEDDNGTFDEIDQGDLYAVRNKKNKNKVTSKQKPKSKINSVDEIKLNKTQKSKSDTGVENNKSSKVKAVLEANKALLTALQGIL